MVSVAMGLYSYGRSLLLLVAVARSHGSKFDGISASSSPFSIVSGKAALAIPRGPATLDDLIPDKLPCSFGTKIDL
jgi:hypothetical protein